MSSYSYLASYNTLYVQVCAQVCKLNIIIYDESRCVCVCVCVCRPAIHAPYHKLAAIKTLVEEIRTSLYELGLNCSYLAEWGRLPSNAHSYFEQKFYGDLFFSTILPIQSCIWVVFMGVAGVLQFRVHILSLYKKRLFPSPQINIFGVCFIYDPDTSVKKSGQIQPHSKQLMLGQVMLGSARLYQVRLGSARLCQVRFNFVRQVRLSQIRLFAS